MSADLRGGGMGFCLAGVVVGVVTEASSSEARFTAVGGLVVSLPGVSSFSVLLEDKEASTGLLGLAGFSDVLTSWTSEGTCAVAERVTEANVRST